MSELFPALSVSLLVLGLSFVCYPWLTPANKWARYATIVVNHAVVLRYLWWRLSETLPKFELSPIVLLAYGIFGIEIVLFNYWMTWSRIRAKETDRTPEADAHLGWYGDAAPLVDVFIPTYNESREILETSIVGAKNIAYGRLRIWILDDGRRDWLEQFALEQGVHYLRRSDNAHYKAGNLNHALKHVLSLQEKPEFLCILDADFVARPLLVERCVALMHDRGVGLVQTCQFFYNHDPYQVAFNEQRHWPEGQSAGFAVTFGCLDALGRAHCLGSAFLVRVADLQEIGGFPTDTVSEDLMTTILLGGRGHRTVFLNEWLATGLAPESLKEFLSQRARWSLGFVQLARLSNRFVKGGGLWARIKYVWGWQKWPVMCVLTFVSSFIPAIYWWTDLSIINASTAAVVSYVLPLWLREVGTCWLSRSAYMPIVADGQTLLQNMVITRATVRAWLRLDGAGFNVTEKGVMKDAPVIYWSVLVPILLMGALAVSGVMHGLYGKFEGVQGGVWALAYFWSLRSLLSVIVAAAPCVELPKRRRFHRFEASEAADLQVGGELSGCRLTSISLGGVSLIARALSAGQRVAINVREVGWLEGVVVRQGDGGYGVALELTAPQRQALILKLYCGDGYIVAPTHWSFLRCTYRVFQYLFPLWRRRPSAAVA